MYLIIGLGNPENEYANTRHNMGFDVINEIAKKYDIQVTQSKFVGLYGMGTIENEKVILLKPQTYMNLSGESIIKFKNFYKIEDKDLIVIYDDVDLEPGNIRVRKKGSSGTHNGMKSVIAHLHTENFARVRVGIGKPKIKEDIINYVTCKISKKDKEPLEEGVVKASEAVIEIIKNNVDSAMNKYN